MNLFCFVCLINFVSLHLSFQLFFSSHTRRTRAYFYKNKDIRIAI